MTVPCNEFVGQIRDRTPAILRPQQYVHRLRDEPDQRD
jgi:hypothetical protein